METFLAIVLGIWNVILLKRYASQVFSYEFSGIFKTNLRTIVSNVNSLKLTSYKNQSTDLMCKSIDWFLYDGKFVV